MNCFNKILFRTKIKLFTKNLWTSEDKLGNVVGEGI